jgi:hypothetical protein
LPRIDHPGNNKAQWRLPVFTEGYTGNAQGQWR